MLGLHPNCCHSPGSSHHSHHSPGVVSHTHTHTYIYIYTHIQTDTLTRWGSIGQWTSILLYCLKTCENSHSHFTMLHCYRLRQETDWHTGVTVAKWQVQTSKLPTARLEIIVPRVWTCVWLSSWMLKSVFSDWRIFVLIYTNYLFKFYEKVFAHFQSKIITICYHLTLIKILSGHVPCCSPVCKLCKRCKDLRQLILANFYTYWRSLRPILADLFQFPKCIILVTFQKASFLFHSKMDRSFLAAASLWFV